MIAVVFLFSTSEGNYDSPSDLEHLITDSAADDSFVERFAEPLSATHARPKQGLASEKSYDLPSEHEYLHTDSLDDGSYVEALADIHTKHRPTHAAIREELLQLQQDGGGKASELLKETDKQGTSGMDDFTKTNKTESIWDKIRKALKTTRNTTDSKVRDDLTVQPVSIVDFAAATFGNIKSIAKAIQDALHGMSTAVIDPKAFDSLRDSTAGLTYLLCSSRAACL